MKYALLILFFITVVLAYNNQEVSLKGNVLYLVNPEMNNNRYNRVICQFNENQVEIFAQPDSSGHTADATIGPYAITDHVLSFPKGNYEIREIPGGYALYQSGILKYRLLTADARKSHLEIAAAGRSSI
ncbi:MAG TPA: hypothetical protein VKB19_07905 [Pedobacter sp.]|nr:hypothetical protein [Pedobacter sp.]